MPPLPPIPLNPNLIDDSAKMYIDVLLQKSHEIRLNRNYTIFNAAIVVVFCLVFGGVLYYRYTSKLSSGEANYKIMKDQEFILSKIRWFKEQNERINQSASASAITGLPSTS